MIGIILNVGAAGTASLIGSMRAAERNDIDKEGAGLAEAITVGG